MLNGVARCILLIVLALLPAPAALQEASAQLPPRDTPVHVTLRLASETNTFHVGELIPLEMVFSADAPNYTVVTGARDRDGRRIELDKFLLSPSSGFSDPYLAVIPGRPWGGPSIYATALDKPQVASFNLNDWIRFDAPGHYRLSVETGRVDQDKADGTWQRSVPLLAGPIEFDVIAADRAWQAHQLTEIEMELSRAAVSDEPAAFRALERLRHLNSPESTRELARRLRGENAPTDYECLEGLLTSSSRAVAIDEVNRLLADPGFPVSERFLDALTSLSIPIDAPRDEHQKAVAASRRQLSSQLANKRGAALAVSLQTVLEMPPRPMTEKLEPEWRDALIAVFALLPVDKQQVWLSQQWLRVKDAAWITLLKQLATRQIDVHFPIDTDASRLLLLSSLALQRWYEFDPASARPAVLAEIARAEPKYNATQLGFLPDRTLPEVGQTLARSFSAATDPYMQRNVSSLMARYADSGVAPAILPLFDGDLHKVDCPAQVNLAGWLLKTREPRAPVVLERVFQHCGDMFAEIGPIVNKNEVVERLAIRELDNPDAMSAVVALRYIRDYGSAMSEQPVWERLMRWNEKWGNRLTALQPRRPGTDDPNGWDRALGMELPQVLAIGRGWLYDEAKLRRLLDVTLETNGRREVQVCLAEAIKQPVHIVYGRGFRIGCYGLGSVEALKDKLLQFPPGTSFIWNDSRSPYYDVLDDALGRQIAEWAAVNGRQITIAPSPWLKQKHM